MSQEEPENGQYLGEETPSACALSLGAAPADFSTFSLFTISRFLKVPLLPRCCETVLPPFLPSLPRKKTVFVNTL